MQSSTLYNHKPKTVHTPCGRPILVIRASVRRTYGIAPTGWVTPTSRDHKDSPGMVAQRDGKDRVDQLPRQAYLAGWPTPTTSNTRTGKASSALSMKRENGSKVQQRLQDFAAIAGPARLTASGEMLIGLDAGMVSGGQLNPAHSRWLMGLPAEWDDCAPTETPSTLKRRQSLSSQ